MTTKREKRVNGIIFAGLMLLAVIYILPIIMMVLGSLKDQAQAGMFNLRLPSVWKFDNYLYVIKKGKILSGYRNSLLITVPATALYILCGAFAGIVLSRRKGKSAGALYYYFIFGLTITLQIAATFAMFKVLGIYGSMFSVILIFAALRLPFTVMTFCSFVKSVPQEIDEAAHMDGCNFLQLVFHILFPVMKPILVMCASITFINCLKAFDLIQTLTGGGPYYATDVLSTFIYQTAFTGSFGSPKLSYACAAAIVILLVASGLYAVKRIIQKVWVRT